MSPATTGWGEQQRDRERELLDLLATLPADHPDREAARSELVLLHLPLVHYLARRYQGGTERTEDVVQVGTVGLLNAVDRFDPTRETAFSTFAAPTIIGAIKRHLRDNTWAVRVPHALQDRALAVGRRTDELARDLGRSPTVAELGDDLGLTQEEVLDAIEARHALAAESLDPIPAEDLPHRAVRSAGDDPGFAQVEDRALLLPLLARLPEREREILRLRFEDELTQTQIAERLGISQMHVSRLLARTLTELRNGLSGD